MKNQVKRFYGVTVYNRICKRVIIAFKTSIRDAVKEFNKIKKLLEEKEIDSVLRLEEADSFVNFVNDKVKVIKRIKPNELEGLKA